MVPLDSIKHILQRLKSLDFESILIHDQYLDLIITRFIDYKRSLTLVRIPKALNHYFITYDEILRHFFEQLSEHLLIFLLRFGFLHWKVQ